MTTKEIISRIKHSVKEAHSFSESLGESNSIHRNYLLKSLSDIPPSEIQKDLIELKELNEIEFGDNSDVILLTKNYKH